MRTIENPGREAPGVSVRSGSLIDYRATSPRSCETAARPETGARCSAGTQAK